MVGQNLTSRFNIFLAIGILNIFCACGEAGFKEVADFKINGSKVLMHNKDYLGIPPDELILKVEGVELILSLTPELFESHRGLYWKVENKPFSVVSTEKRIKINELNVQKPTRISLCEGLEGPCLSAFVSAKTGGNLNVMMVSETPSISMGKESLGADQISDKTKVKPKLESVEEVKKVQKQEISTIKNTELKKEKVDLNSNTESQNIDVERQRLAREVEEREAREELDVRTKAEEEKLKLKAFLPNSTGLVNKLSSAAALNDESENIVRGAITIRPAKNLILFEAKLKVEGDGKVEFNLSGEGIRKEINLIKNVNDGLNTIRFTDIKQVVLQAGKSYVLQFECLGDVKAIVIKKAFFDGNSNAELSLTGKQILYDLSYKF